MGNENEGKLIIDARGTTKKVSPAEPTLQPVLPASAPPKEDSKIPKPGDAVDRLLENIGKFGAPVAAGALAVGEAVEETRHLIDKLKKPEEKEKTVQPGVQQVEQSAPIAENSPKKDYSALSVSQLQQSILRADLGSDELKSLREEKQKRVDELAELFKSGQSVAMGDRIETAIRSQLEMVTPDYYQVPLDKLKKGASGGVATGEGNPRLEGLYAVVFTDEVDRVSEKIYEGAETSTDPVVNRVDVATRKSVAERVLRSRVDAGVRIDNPVDILGQLPATFDDWKQNYSRGYDAEMEKAAANYYKQAEDQQRIREAMLKMQAEATRGQGTEGGYGLYGRPKDSSTVPELNSGEGGITERSINMWGLPPFFLVQPQIGVWARVNVANVFNQMMDIGSSTHWEAMWNSQEFSRVPREKMEMFYLGLAPVLKLCSDASRKIGDLTGTDKEKGKLASYGVNEALTAKFLLFSENQTTRKVLGAFYALGGYKSTDQTGYSFELNQFIEDNGEAFRDLSTALRAQDLGEQKKKLEAISDKMANLLVVDKGLARICLEFYELFGEPGLNFDLGRMRQFYYDGRGGYPPVVKTLPLDESVVEQDKQNRLIKTKELIADRQKALRESNLDDSDRVRTEREISQFQIEISTIEREDTKLYIRNKLERIKQARLKTLGVLESEGVKGSGYLKDKQEALTKTKEEFDTEINPRQKVLKRRRIRKLESDMKVLQEEVDTIKGKDKGTEHVRKWANDIITRSQGDGLYSFLGMLDSQGNSIEEWESEALGILNRPLYLRAEEATMQSLREKMLGVVMEKGALSFGEGLAKGGIDVMIEMMSKLGASKVGGAWEAEATILSTFDKVAGMAQRRDTQFYLMTESDLLGKMKEEMDKLRLRQPFTLISQETYDRMMAMRIVPPVEKKEESQFLTSAKQATQRDAKRRTPRIRDFFQNLREFIEGFAP